MSVADMLLPEFDQEMESTRRVIERVPREKDLGCGLNCPLSLGTRSITLRVDSIS